MLNTLRVGGIAFANWPVHDAEFQSGDGNVQSIFLQMGKTSVVWIQKVNPLRVTPLEVPNPTTDNKSAAETKMYPKTLLLTPLHPFTTQLDGGIIPPIGQTEAPELSCINAAKRRTTHSDRLTSEHRLVSVLVSVSRFTGKAPGLCRRLSSSYT